MAVGLLVEGVIFVLAVVFLPNGVVGTIQRGRRAREARQALLASVRAQ